MTAASIKVFPASADNNTMNEIKNLWRDAGAFAQAYVEAALWSSLDDNDEPLDKNYNWTHLAPEALQKMISDCNSFQEANRAFLARYPTKQAGHDFWLTRNGHGCGFWENDFGSEADCEALTDACDTLGECYLYVNGGTLYVD